MTRPLCLPLLALLAAVPSAHAQRGPTPAATPAVTQGELEPPPLRLAFDEGEQVEGTLARPDDTRVEVVQRFRHASLVKGRMSFLPEMIQASLDH